MSRVELLKKLQGFLSSVSSQRAGGGGKEGGNQIAQLFLKFWIPLTLFNANIGICCANYVSKEFGYNLITY